MNLANIHSAYFIGIGGIGMSALARYFVSIGIDVSGYDKVKTNLTKELENEGMKIHYEDNITKLNKSVDLVVYTPAVPVSHEELKYYRKNDYQVLKRAEVLGLMTKDHFTIAVAGSHGKTTVTSMIAHILKYSGYDCTAFIGGIAVNYQTNFIAGKNKVMVVEADEYDRSFLSLHPNIAVVTTIDSDHLDIYGSSENLENAFVQFTEQIVKPGTLVGHLQLPIFDQVHPSKVIKYSLNDKESDVHIVSYKVLGGAYQFDISINKDIFTGWELNIGGIHNLENALAATAVSQTLGIDLEKIKNGLATFKGIRRRFEKVYESETLTFIDDYAHHPKELEMLLKSVRELYPNRKVTVVFQPHLYSRTKGLAKEFAQSLDQADEVFLLPIYPAREKPIPGVMSEIILKEMCIADRQVITQAQLLNILKSKKLEVLLTVGAGDIDHMVPLIKESIIPKK